LFASEPFKDAEKIKTPVTMPVHTPVVDKPLKRLTKQMKSPSIKDALAGKFDEEKLSAKEQHEIYTQAGATAEFTAESLKQKWDEFISRLHDRPNLQSTLSRVPRLEENFRLVLDIDNSVQDDLINTIKPELVSWLRKELKNSRIQLITLINETEKKKIIYTDTEKYHEMVKKNPRIELLKQRFKLDFE
jgi:hypothetical protein